MYVEVKVINKSGNSLPKYETIGSAGMDICADLGNKVITMLPGNIYLIPTGLYVSIPRGYEAQIRARSGLAVKHGITLINGIGTVDSDYRGEIKVALINHGKESFEVRDGDRIAQLVLAEHATVAWAVTEDLDETERGSGGFGHTGIN